MSVTADQVKQAFEENADASVTPEVLQECESFFVPSISSRCIRSYMQPGARICNMFGISAEDFYYKWAAMSFNSSHINTGASIGVIDMEGCALLKHSIQQGLAKSQSTQARRGGAASGVHRARRGPRMSGGGAQVSVQSSSMPRGGPPGPQKPVGLRQVFDAGPSNSAAASTSKVAVGTTLPITVLDSWEERSCEYEVPPTSSG